MRLCFYPGDETETGYADPEMDEPGRLNNSWHRRMVLVTRKIGAAAWQGNMLRWRGGDD